VSAELPADHATRLVRAFDALEGLSVGDAFGQQYFYFPEMIRSRTLSAGPLHWTDDTAMAVSLFEVLQRHGKVDQDDLANRFASRYAAEPSRGYGLMAHNILRSLAEGEDWKSVSQSAFGGAGSLGNGAAMRVAPLGAYFADDLQRTLREAERSAEVTHSHPDGIAGAVAVAVAAAVATHNRHYTPDQVRKQIWTAVLDLTPASPTKDGIEIAYQLPSESDIDSAAGRLGTGDKVISSDTVPFCIWSAVRWLEDYEEALWATVAGLGDRDTTCAIVGGIVAAYRGRNAIPSHWRLEREPLPVVEPAS